MQPELIESPPDCQRLPSHLDEAVANARRALMALQDADGCWSFELEADCTISAEYILMMHFMDELDASLQDKIATYLRARQGPDGGWPLYIGGDFDVSCSVKAYYALKFAGDSPDAPHMARARKAILAHGGAVKCNVFTRIMLAQFGQIPWRGVPYMPVEIMLLPRWFPFHISKVSYWSRTVMIPLFILYTMRARAKNPSGVGVGELFTVPPEREKRYFPIRSGLNRMFLTFEKLASYTEPFIPPWLRRRALRKAETWMIERLNGDGGLGAIFPAMVNAYEALACLGYPADHPYRVSAKQALQDLLVISEDSAYCQPCNSPVWDTALACLTMQACESDDARDSAMRGLDWLKDRQLLDAPGDWRQHRPRLEGGGWPFQFKNDHYPDIDDTSAVTWAMHHSGHRGYDESIRRAANWIRGMQSRNGGFASFDIDNAYEYLNEIPFADHGALLDPPTSDVSARCAILLGMMARRDEGYQSALDQCMAYLRDEQEENGSWFGRWGTNYIYGTWSTLAALEEVGMDRDDPMIRRAVAWLVSVQRPDGGWGEDHDTYVDPAKAGQGHTSTAFQTAWAMLGLMAAGERNSLALRRGAAYLLRMQQADGLWKDDWFTAPGFPRVFYLKYHGYDKFFPLWALARYRALVDKQVS
ncbi:MAG: squalene--hopene cyclase [Mariprofundaceae bacterium]